MDIDALARDLDALVAGIDFSMPGRDQALGRDLAGVIAQGIVDRTVAEQRSVDGGVLKANVPQYRAWKAAKYGSYQPLVRTGQMTSFPSVLGEVTIVSSDVRMRYGTGSAPTSSSTGYLSDSDRAVTDRDKAGYVSDDRPFYGLDDRIADAVIEAAGDALDDYLRTH